MKRNMRKNGFTLIELLAVIVILAVIVLIAIPIVLNLISSSRKGAYKDSCYGLIETANIYMANRLADGNFSGIFKCNGKTCETATGEKLNFKGEVPIGGSVVIKNRKVTLDYIKYPNFCAYGTLETLFVSTTCSDLDTTESIIDLSKRVISKTTTSIIVDLLRGFAIDAESGINQITVKLYKKNSNTSIGEITKQINDEVSPDEEFVFNSLETDTDYQIEVIVVNGAEGATKLDKVDVRTGKIEIDISSSTTGGGITAGVYKSVVEEVTFNQTNVTNSAYYIKTTDVATVPSGKVIAKCGNDVNPDTCENSSDVTLSAGYWYKVNGSVNVTYNAPTYENPILYAVVYDGNSYSAATTATVPLIFYNAVDIGYTTSYNNVVTNVEQALDDLYVRYNN